MMSSSNSLIRPEAIHHKHQKQYSALVITQSPMTRLMVVVMACCLLAAIAVLMLIRYKESFSAKGIIESVDPTSIVTSPDYSFVESLYVEEGQWVEEGELLLTLTTEVLDGNGHSEQDSEILQLEVERDLVKQRLHALRERSDTDSKRLEAKAHRIGIQSESLESSLLLLSERSSLIENNLASLKTLLDSSNISQYQFDQELLISLELEHERSLLKTEKASLENSLNDIHLERQSIHLGLLVEQVESEASLRRIENEINKRIDRRLISVVARSSGIVAGLTVQQGMATRAHQVLLKITPNDRNLQATIYVPSKHIGKIHTEQTLLLEFDSFPVSEFGFGTAIVSSIAKAPIDPRNSLMPLTYINEPVFKITALLEKNYVEGFDTHPLIPGISVSANFITEELSLLEFIFKPALNLKGKVLW